MFYLVRQVADDGFVGFQPSHDEGSRHFLESFTDLLITMALDGLCIL